MKKNKRRERAKEEKLLFLKMHTLISPSQPSLTHVLFKVLTNQPLSHTSLSQYKNYTQKPLKHSRFLKRNQHKTTKLVEEMSCSWPTNKTKQTKIQKKESWEKILAGRRRKEERRRRRAMKEGRMREKEAPQKN